MSDAASPRGPKVVVGGPRGRMGRLIVGRVEGAQDLELVGTVDRGEDLAAILDRTGAEVFVDVSGPSAARLHAELCLRRSVAVVVGSSGLGEADLDALRGLAAERGGRGLWVPNFSVAAVLLQQFCERAARWWEHAEIVEAHHEAKKDAPSGTALNTAHRIAERWRRLSRDPGSEAGDPTDRSRGRSVGGVRIHALRLPGVVADQEVRFGGEGEWLSLRHVTTDRESFMPGVLLAIRRVGGLSGFHVGLDAVLDLGS